MMGGVALVASIYPSELIVDSSPLASPSQVRLKSRSPSKIKKSCIAR